MGFGCSTWQSKEEPGCGFVVWKRSPARSITEDVAARARGQRADEGALGLPLARPGKPFRAMLVLDPQAERAVSFEFKERPQRGAKNGASGNEEEPAEMAG